MKKKPPDQTKKLWGESPTTWLAVVLASLSLVVSVLSYQASRTATAYSIRPLVAFDIEDDTDDVTVGVKVTNSGPGPAVVQNISYYVDGKYVGDYDAATDAGKLTSDSIKYFDYDPGDPISVGEASWIYYAKTNDKNGLQQFVDFIDNRLAIKVRYCSLGGECWEKCSISGKCGQPKANR